ncbi:MAG: hypothetical protein ACUZ8E_00985 [Candidatus Anammoxibacter sp.]
MLKRNKEYKGINMGRALFKGALALCVVFAVIVLMPSTAFAVNVPFSTGTVTANFVGARSVYAADVDGEYFILKM